MPSAYASLSFHYFSELFYEVDVMVLVIHKTDKEVTQIKNKVSKFEQFAPRHRAKFATADILTHILLKSMNLAPGMWFQ